jgi:hypothetical protein
MMTIQNAPTWFALQILLQGVQHQTEFASQASYWSCLFMQKKSLIDRLKEEMFEQYSELKDPPEIHKQLQEYVTQLSLLSETQLEGKALSDFKEMANAVQQLVSKELGNYNN